MRPLLLLLGTAAALTGCARANEGAFAAHYQAKLFASCEAAEPYQGSMPSKRLKQFCTCTSETVARRFTVSELQRMDQLPSDPALDKRVDAIFAQCAGYSAQQGVARAGQK